MKKVALFGNVNTEEIIAYYLTQEGVVVDGYLLFSNEAFEKRCRKYVVLSEQDETYIEEKLPQLLKEEAYDFILLGPDFMVSLISPVLLKNNIVHIGSNLEQLSFETDKSMIYSVFGKESNILPRKRVIETRDPDEIVKVVNSFSGNYVLKFVGDYASRYEGSPVGRIRFSGETIGDINEVVDFVQASVSVSGKCVVEEKVHGREFSANYVVDKNRNFLRLGENICFKRRENGNRGAICDGTGSVSINNTLPFLSQDDIAFVEKYILEPFCDYVVKVSGKPLCSILNLDLMKKDNGKIVLFEVNMREAGGHTMANVLSGLNTSLYDILKKAQAGELDSLQISYKSGASIVVSAFPSYFPFGISDDSLLEEKITKQIPNDINLFTGWVEVLEETEQFRLLRMQNSPILLFEHFADDIEIARQKLYAAMKNIVPVSMDYRTDIGMEL